MHINRGMSGCVYYAYVRTTLFESMHNFHLRICWQLRKGFIAKYIVFLLKSMGRSTKQKWGIEFNLFNVHVPVHAHKYIVTLKFVFLQLEDSEKKNVWFIFNLKGYERLCFLLSILLSAMPWISRKYFCIMRICNFFFAFTLRRDKFKSFSFDIRQSNCCTNWKRLNFIYFILLESFVS